MPRGFLAGLMLGAVAGGAGLGMLSLVAPLPEGAAPEAEQQESSAAPARGAAAQPLPATAPEAAPETLPEAAETQAQPATEPSEPLADGAAEAPVTLAPPEAVSPASPDAPALTAPPGDAAPEAPVPPQPAPAAPALPAPGSEAPVADSSADAAPAGLPGPVVSEIPANLPETTDAAPAEEASELPAASQGEALAGSSPAAGAGTAPRLIRPNAGLNPDVEGVRQDRLPRIGDAPAGEEAPADLVPVVDALKHYARSFANPLSRPPFAVLLLDDGSMPEGDLDALAGSPLPLTLVIDPAREDAADRAAVWRSAGQEVALLARDIPAAAQPADGEIAVEAMTRAVPEALALVVPPGGGALQADRTAAAAVMPALHSRGFGLVTWDQGLNAGDQVARREGLPAVTIYRDLNGNDETGPVIGRYLDRAAFKAQQDGRAVVFGRLDAVTAATLLEWSLTARAASLALAPLSAVLE